MKNLKQIIQEKLRIGKSIKIGPTEYTFEGHKLGFTIHMPFNFYFPEVHKTSEIVYIEQSKNGYDEDVWIFFERDDETSTGQSKVVQLSAVGVYNVFIKGPQTNNFSKVKPFIYNINGKSVYAHVEIELEDMAHIMVDESLSLNEKLRIGKSIKYKCYRPNNLRELKNLIQDLIDERGNNADLNDIDTSEINDMSQLFFNSEFDGDISNWDVSNVTDMLDMFRYSKFTGKNGDISNWDVSNVTDMYGMFTKSEFNGDISKWKVKDTTDTREMFTYSPLENNPPKWYKP